MTKEALLDFLEKNKEESFSLKDLQTKLNISNKRTLKNYVYSLKADGKILAFDKKLGNSNNIRKMYTYLDLKEVYFKNIQKVIKDYGINVNQLPLDTRISLMILDELKEINKKGE